MKKNSRLSHVMLIALVVSFALAPISQAAYEYKYKLAVDHTRVAGLDGTPPSGFGYLKSITIDHSQVAGSSVTPPTGFGYVKKITIDNTMVSGTSDLSDFPVLVSIQNDALLKTTANGGRVTDPEGDDIVFYAADLTTVLDYEVEQYDGTTGTLVAWVRLPVLSFALDTVFYLAYGNSSPGSPPDPAGVWDSNFKSVWHLDSTLADSNNGNDLTNSGSMPASSGKIGPAREFGGDGDYLEDADAENYINGLTAVTVSAWIKSDVTNTDKGVFYGIVPGEGEGDSYLGIRYDTAGADGGEDDVIKYSLQIDNGVGQLQNESSASVQTTNWQHVVLRWSSGNNLELFIDGELDTPTYLHPENPAIGALTSHTTFVIGKGGKDSSAGAGWAGLIDEVRISDTARSAAWIATEYNNQSSPAGFMTIEDSGALVNFPVLVSINNDATIKTTGNGGRVTDAEGDDLVFYAADLTTVLDYEVEQYDGAAGTLVAWVRMPALANDVDTVFYLAYGNNSINSPQTLAADVWDSNFKAVWHLGDDFVDSTSNPNDGTNSGSTDTAAKIADGQDFDGNNDYVDVGSDASIDNIFAGGGTVEAWIRPDDWGENGVGRVADKGTSDAGWGFEVDDGLGANDSLRFVQLRTGLTGRWNTPDNSITLGDWHHVVLTYDEDSTDNNPAMYIDGQSQVVTVIAAPNGTVRPAAGGPLYLGNISEGTTSTFEGLIDEVRLSSTVRSAAWITTGYNNQSNPGGFMTIRENGPLVDFPVLVSIQTDAQLKTVDNGGQVTDAEGDDIIFTANADGSGPLDHEVESYDPVNGTLTAWVRIPALAVSEDTIFYLHYGDSGVTDPTESPAGVWDDYYRGVWHLAEPVTHGATGGTHVDSTGVNDGTQNKNGSIAGWIAGAQYFDGNGDYVDIGNPLNGAATGTISAWVKHDSLPARTERYVSIGSSMFIRHDGNNSVGQLHFGVNTAVGDYQALRINGALTTDTWYHVAGTWDGKTQIVYLNGQQLDRQTLKGTLPASTDSYISNNNEEMDGIIDEARVSDMARPGDWITTTYNNQRWPNKAQHPAEGFITVVRSVCQAAVPVTCGDTTAGSIEAPGAWDAFKVTVGADSWLEVYTTGTTDTYGHLYDENCEEIAQDDTVDYNFNISQAVAAGDYYVQVRHASEIGTGDYDLVVACGDDDHGDNIDEATPIDCGSPAAGKIEPAGDEDYFKVVFWGTGILTASTSGGTDTQGTLLDDGGIFIAADDNSKDGSNFEIVRSVSPGVYYIMVSSTAGGDYSVQVDCEYTPVITATAEYGGAISPAGGVGVTYDGSQTFTITPAAGNTIRDVWVDGEWVGAVSSYEFQNVQKDHKIVAVFNADFENCVDIPDIPLDAWYRSAPANVMFVLDDSGSMDWEFMTTSGDGLFDDYYRYVFDDPGDNLYGRVLPDDQRLKWKSQWAGHNKLYYDPAVDYQPWPNDDDGDPAATLDPADKNTPLSHPMETKTFDLNMTYVQYTNDAVVSAIIVNDQDSGFSKTATNLVGGGAETTLLDTGFEDTNWDKYFEDNGGTSWQPDTLQQHAGTHSAVATKNSGGDLKSNDLDASDLVDGDTMTVEFWLRKSLVTSDKDVKLYYYKGGGKYDEIAKLGDLDADEKWLHCSYTITGTQYFISDFHIYIKATPKNNDGKVWLDDVLVKKSGGPGGWELATGSDQAHDGDYWWTATDGDYTASWTADISDDGEYDVFARWPAADNHAQSVRYTVNHDDGSNFVDVDQRQNGGDWFKLGKFDLVAGETVTVVLSHSRSGDDDRAVADAIKIAPAGATGAIDIKRAHYYVRSDTNGKVYLVVLDGGIDYYLVKDANGNDTIDAGELAQENSPPADVQPARTYDEERQNFANWYQFYRRRELAATAAVSNVIAGLKGVQVGFYSINGNLVNPVVPVKSAGIDKSKNLLKALYNLKIRAQGTPLRRGLREVGKYFADSSKMIGSSPYATLDNGGACQQAFTIVMTDGFWNGKSPAVGNADGNDDTAFDGGGYADIYPQTLADVAMKYYETDLHSGLDDSVPANVLDPATHQHMVTYTVSFGRTGSLNPDDYDTANGDFPAWTDPRHASAHKIDDLWHAAVNGRGEFLSASSPTELIDALLAISRNIQSRIASSSSVSVNGDPLYQELTEYTRMYQATYRSDSWVGDVSAYKIDAGTGDVADTPEWTAADRLEALDWSADRIIATYDGSDGVPFRYDRTVLSAGQQWALGSDLVVGSADEQRAEGILNYVRGERGNEKENGGTFRDRFQVLGDIVHSSPVYHNGMLYAGGNDGMLHAFDAASGDEKFAYVPRLVFGNLSALVDPEYSHKYFVDLSPTIQDVTIGGQAKTILVGGLGKGGKGYYALDVTDPSAISDESELADRVLWEYPDPQSDGQGSLAYKNLVAPIAVGDQIVKMTDPPNALNPPVVAEVAAIPLADVDEKIGRLDLISVGSTGSFLDGDDLYVGNFASKVKVAEVDGELFDPYMGFSYSRPVIARSNDPAAEWLVIFGNGYNSAKSHAVLYILNLYTGELVKRIDTGVGNCNGMSSPIAIDIDANGTADYVYAGDLQGNLWKFDLFDTDAANWESAYADTGGNPAPVFQAKNYGGHTQPITSKPDVMYHCSQPGYMVMFGTGRYLTELDLESTETSSIYGIWDYGDDDDDSEYLGSFERTATPQLDNPHLDTVATWTRVKLLEQTVEAGTWTTADGQTLRVITANSPVWGTVADGDVDQSDPQPDPGSVTAGDTVHAGWFFDLPNPGEMAVSDVIIRDSKLLVISFTPGQDPCGYGGTSIFHAMDACTGARPGSSFFVNIDEMVHDGGAGETTITKISSDWKEPTGVEFSGRLQPPVILRKGNLEYHYLSSSTGDVHKQEAAGTRMGIFYWMQIE